MLAEAGLLRGRRRRRPGGAALRRAARPVETGIWSRSRAARAPPAGGQRRRGGATVGGSTTRTAAGSVHGVEALAGQSLGHCRPPARAAARHLRRHRLPAAPALRARHSAAGVVEHDRHGRQAVPPGRRQPRRPSLRVESERVDHRGQPAPQPVLDDQVEQREGVRARGWSCSPSPTSARSRSVDTTWSGAKSRGRPRRLPAPEAPPAPPGTGRAAGRGPTLVHGRRGYPPTPTHSCPPPHGQHH